MIVTWMIYFIKYRRLYDHLRLRTLRFSVGDWTMKKHQNCSEMFLHYPLDVLKTRNSSLLKLSIRTQNHPEFMYSFVSIFCKFGIANPILLLKKDPCHFSDRCSRTKKIRNYSWRLDSFAEESYKLELIYLFT